MKILLVNANLVRIPPIAPYALDVLGSALTDGGHEVAICDLTHGPAGPSELDLIDQSMDDVRPDAVAVSLRNTGDLFFPSTFDTQSRGSYLPDHRRVIDRIAQHVHRSRIIVGGSGFSTNPQQVLADLGLQYGVRGPGEHAMIELLPRLGRGGRELGPVILDGRRDAPYAKVRRTFIDNARYYREGGLGAVRTSNGCGMRCSYCVEPMAKGPVFRRRSVEDVLTEIDQLVEQGIYDIHSADSEFNLPVPHAMSILRGIIDRGYPPEVRFWLYCQPAPFPPELAQLMERAHVAGINFGTDHTDPEMLRSVGKWYTHTEIEETTKRCHDHGIAVMHVLLFGAPGDTPDKMYRSIDAVWKMRPRVIGAILGLAVLPETDMAIRFEQQGCRSGNGFILPDGGIPYLDPVFYVDPAFPIPSIFDEVRRFVGDRVTSIMVPSVNSRSGETGQIVASERVAKQLASGIRGAYWYHYPDLMSASSAQGG